LLSRFKLDPFSVALLAIVALASLLPITGRPAEIFSAAIKVGIAAMFFFYGARLAREALLTAIVHWRLHVTVLAMTYALFPILGLLLSIMASDVLSVDLRNGLIFLCFLPSTVQSSIAFTSIARGNVPAAVCAASTSNLLGVFLTPLLVGVFIHTTGEGFSFQSIQAIVVQLLLPFLAGQLMRPLVAAWTARHQKALSLADRTVILLVVYGAFSAAVTGGLWNQLSVQSILLITGLCAVLLALVLVITTFASRALGFSREDEIAIVFCGSKKSLATGIPMAGVLFSATSIGMMVFPLMLFHQMQLLACAFLAQRYAKQPALPG